MKNASHRFHTLVAAALSFAPALAQAHPGHSAFDPAAGPPHAGHEHEIAAFFIALGITAAFLGARWMMARRR